MALTRLGANQSVNLASNVTGTLPIANGGTALTSGFVNGGVNTPAFVAKLSTNMTSQAANTTVKIQYNTEVFDTDNAYDNSTNYRFTVPSGEAGKYAVFQHQHMRDQGQDDNIEYMTARLYKNGSFFTEFQRAHSSSTINGAQSNYCTWNIVMDLSAGDYLEWYAKVYNTSFKIQEEGSYIGAYKLIT